jgi:SAM-dependent methyltransferase
MVELARHDHPGARFEVGSMTELSLADASVAGLLAFWSLIHIPDAEIPVVLGQFRRVLRPGGLLLAGFHAGEGSRLKTEGYGGHTMNVYVHRRTPERMSAWLRDAGFTIEAQLLDGPDGNVPGSLLFARSGPAVRGRLTADRYRPAASPAGAAAVAGMAPSGITRLRMSR